MKKIKFSDIVISSAFAESVPSEQKVQKYRDRFAETKVQSKYLVLDNENVLVDGYIQYLILKENNMEEAKYVRSGKFYNKKKPTYRIKETTYVYGTHPNSKCTKEFVWRVPEGWIDFAENIKVGDTIYCKTKFGVAPVVVGRIEVNDLCPVDIPVRKVANKIVESGELRDDN